MNSHGNTDADDSLRLEDVGRRSACDRCRGMKTRCERPHNHAIAQLQQCRRCRKANVRCITTLEAQHNSNEGEERPSQKRRKSEMTGSPSASPKTRGQPSRTNSNELKDQAYGTLMDFGSQPTSTLPIDLDVSNNFFPPYGLDFQWFDDGKMAQFQSNNIHKSGKEDSITTTTSVLSSPTLQISDGDLSISTMSISNMNPLPQSQFPELMLAQQNDDIMVWDELISPSQSSLSDFSFPSGTTESVMRKLVEFNAQVVHDMQTMKAGTTDQIAERLLSKTLRHSKMFMELLRSLIRRDSGSGGGDASPPTEKIDNDMALLLLSSNLNVIRMYESLCIVLDTQHGQHEETQAQFSHGLEYLQGLDVDIRVQASVHICSLAFVQIRKMFDDLQRTGLLTQSAATTFHAVLGGGNSEHHGSKFDTTTIVDTLQKLVMGRRC